MECSLHYPKPFQVLQTHDDGTLGIPYIWWHIYYSNLCGRKLENREHTGKERISKTRYSRDETKSTRGGEERGDFFSLDTGRPSLVIRRKSAYTKKFICQRLVLMMIHECDSDTDLCTELSCRYLISPSTQWRGILLSWSTGRNRSDASMYP